MDTKMRHKYRSFLNKLAIFKREDTRLFMTIFFLLVPARPIRRARDRRSRTKTIEFVVELVRRWMRLFAK